MSIALGRPPSADLDKVELDAAAPLAVSTPGEGIAKDESIYGGSKVWKMKIDEKDRGNIGIGMIGTWRLLRSAGHARNDTAYVRV